MKKSKRRTFLSAFCSTLLLGCVTYRRDSEAIREDLLELTPLGSGFAEVEAKLKKKYTNVQKSLNTGFLRRVIDGEELVGAKAIWVDIGNYRTGLFSTTFVAAYWGFDQSGKLIDIWVRKDVDSL